MGASWEDNPKTVWLFNWLHVVTRPINRLWRRIFERKIRVKVNDHDVWNLDNTLAHIILPCLILIKEQKYGYPMVDKEDWPEGVDDLDDEGAWSAVLDQMIWSFQEIIEPTDEKFYHNSDNQRLKFVALENGCSQLEFETIDETKPVAFFDKDRHKAHHDKIAHGLILFGKYYRGLWT